MNETKLSDKFIGEGVIEHGSAAHVELLSLERDYENLLTQNIGLAGDRDRWREEAIRAKNLRDHASATAGVAESRAIARYNEAATLRAQRDALVAALREIRDDVLHDRGPLDGIGMDSDKTNAVLAVIDDASAAIVRDLERDGGGENG